MGLAFLLILVVSFALGYVTRSYLGALVPMSIFASVVYVLRILEPIEGAGGRPQPYDTDVLDDVALVASGLVVLTYLAGVLLARRRRAIAPDGTNPSPSRPA